jgi:hypothetical protein
MNIDSQQGNVPQFCKIFIFFALLSGEGQLCLSGYLRSVSVRCAGRKEKERLMQATLKRTALMIILALALLLSLVGWTARMMAAPATPAHLGLHSSHTIAYYCPPPPRYC